ncbi:GGDEF domain-containing protein [Planctobacterium marinum]
MTSLVILLVVLSVWLVLLVHLNAQSTVNNIDYNDVVSEVFSIAFILLLLGVNMRLESDKAESKLMFVGFCCMLIGDGHDLLDEFVKIHPDWLALVFENIATNLGIVIVAVAVFLWSGRYKEQLSLLKRQKEILTDASNTDPLTKLYNRRFLTNEFIQKMLTGNDDKTRTLLLLDLDRFKAVNDNYGHATGDRLIVLIADVIKSEIREQDYAFRYGGEEFLVVLNCNREMAFKVAERIRVDFATSSFKIDGQELVKSTSIGLFELPSEMGFEQALDITDKALYRAKQNGRNCIVEGTLCVS